jgi:protocatechuate 3,4-dioxygenase beta subunit
MRAARVAALASALTILVLVGLWVYRGERAADVAAPAAETTPATTTTAASADAPIENSVAASVAATPTKTPAASAPASSFSSFRGRVIDAATREPVREFVVEFLGTQATKAGDEAPGARTFKSDDGRFEWDFLPPGAWAAIVSADSYQRFELSPLRLPAGEATAELVMPLRRGHLLRGRVYDENTGAGIPDANVQFREADVERWAGNFRMRPQEKTGKDGVFELDGVPPGRIKLTVWAQNYAGTELDITVVENTPGVEIALVTGGTIAGRLTAADGITPVIGSVGIFSEDTQSGGGRRTGDAGQFSFGNLQPGRYQVTGKSEAGSVAREVTLARGQRMEDLVLAVGMGRSIRGVVTGVRPDLLTQVRVSVQRMDLMGGIEARVDERGAYTMTGVMPGRFAVAADVASRVQLSKQVVMTAESDLTVDFAFPPGARVSGRVTRQGRPVPGVEVNPRPLVQNDGFYHYGTHTSREGDYAIEQLPAGDYYFYAGTFRSKRLRVSGDTTFDIEIPGVQLSGRVVEAGKIPVVGAQVELWDSNPDGQHVHVQQQTDHFGMFELVGIEPGDYMLTAYKPGYAMYRDRFTYTAPAADLLLSLQREKGVEIRVRYADTGGVPDHIYVVEQLARQHGTRLHLALDEFGVGYLPGALSGKTLSFASGHYKPVVIRDWSGQSLDLRLVRPKSQ